MKTRSVLASWAVLVAGLATVASLSPGAAAAATARVVTHRPSMHPNVRTAGLISITVTKYGSVLADRSRFTLYLLSTEAGTKLHCKSSACLATWPPLLITKGQKISIGSGVKGKVGTVARSSTTLQVTFSGYPVYTFAGDTGPAQTKGEGLVQFGGAWYMLHPAATSPGTTPVH